MTTRYRILFAGDLQNGFTRQKVIENLAAVSRMEQSKAEKLLMISKPTVLKKGLEKDAAEKLAALLSKAGLQVKMQTEKPQEKQTAVETGQEAPKAASSPPEEKSAENPYAAPSASLSVTKEVTGEWRDMPRKVRASRGWSWVGEALKLFFGQPGKWLGMGVVGAIISVLIMIIPIIGSLLYYIPAMVFAGGLMLAAQQQVEGNRLEIKYLFSGFSHNRNQLVLLGVLYLAGILVISLFIGVLALTFLGANILPHLLGTGTNQQIFEPTGTNAAIFMLILLVAFALSIPLMMAVWLSPPLVVLGDRSAVEAFRLSFLACFRNILPFLVYGLAFFLIIALLFAVVGAAMAGLVFLVFDGGSIFFMFLPILFLMILGIPLMLIGCLSIYTSFADIFAK